VLGYDRTTMRSVAMEAGVDQKLVAYFFVSKQQLFIAATELPVDPAEALPAVLAGGAEGTGERLAAHVVGILEDRSTGGQMTGLVRAAASEPQATQMVRDLLTDGILVPVANSLAVDRPALRVALVSSQIVGLLMARYIMGIEPLASLPAEEVQALLAPTFQRYLVGDLKE
jgi:AcrR family transcriptional regulator